QAALVERFDDRGRNIWGADGGQRTGLRRRLGRQALRVWAVARLLRRGLSRVAPMPSTRLSKKCRAKMRTRHTSLRGRVALGSNCHQCPTALPSIAFPGRFPGERFKRFLETE